MPLFKKNLTPIFVLAGCLIIAFFSYNWTDNKQIETNNKDSSVIQEETKELDLFKNIQSINSDNSQEENINLSEEKIKENPSDNQNQILTSINTEAENTEAENNNLLSIEDIITEAENLSLILKNKFDQKKEQELSNPPCLGVLAVSGGVCNCATLGCTPPTGTWCINPCCCVCCAACCGI